MAKHRLNTTHLAPARISQFCHARANFSIQNKSICYGMGCDNWGESGFVKLENAHMFRNLLNDIILLGHSVKIGFCAGAGERG